MTESLPSESAAQPDAPSGTIDPFVPLRRTGLDPLPELAALRAETPVRKLEFPFGISAWLVSGYDQAKSVLGAHQEFSNDFANVTTLTGGMASAEQNPGGLGMADPPAHTRLRKMLTPEFTMRRLQRLTPRITEIVDQLLDGMTSAGSPVDFVQAFAMPLPSLVICELLDVPYPDREAFGKLSGARFDIFGGAGTGLEAISESLQYMGELVKRQRAKPGDGLLGMLIRTYGDQIDDTELAGLADGVLIGGHETTASMLALGAIALLSSPDRAETVRGGDADAVHRAVEELLRYLTVVQVAFPRFARQDIEVAGQQIKAGEMVLVSLSGANRDPVLGEDLETLDLARVPTSHHAFGYGIHRCVGSELARMELRIAYPALLQRFPTLRLDKPLSEISFREYSVVFGVEDLPVAW
jgi:cytochrome P450